MFRIWDGGHRHLRGVESGPDVAAEAIEHRLDVDLADALERAREEGVHGHKFPSGMDFNVALAELGVEAVDRIRSTPTYVGEPECNGVAERFIRTLKEECIHLHDFETLEARAVIGAFVERRNNGWLLQRHGYMTPARAREKLSRSAA